MTAFEQYATRAQCQQGLSGFGKLFRRTQWMA